MILFIIGYYHYADGVRAAGESFERSGWEVKHFPLMEKISEEMWDAELVSFLNTGDGIALWWYPIHQISSDKIKHVVDSARRKHIYFNWDPSYLPIDTRRAQGVIQKKKEAYPFMNLVISVNPLEASAFPNTVYCSPGFSGEHHYPEYNSEYVCDVSFVGTNLYEDEESWPLKFQRYNRGKLIDLIYRSDLKFRVYGPSHLKERFPEAYVSSIPYSQTRLVYSNSLINISVNCVSIDGYFSERVPQIMASRGVVYTDNHLGFGFIEGEDYILLDREDPLSQIREFLTRKEDLERIRNSAYKRSSNISWNNLRDIVING